MAKPQPSFVYVVTAVKRGVGPHGGDLFRTEAYLDLGYAVLAASKLIDESWTGTEIEPQNHELIGEWLRPDGSFVRIVLVRLNWSRLK